MSELEAMSGRCGRVQITLEIRKKIVFNTLTSLVATLADFLHVTLTREAGETAKLGLVGICKWGDFARKTETERKKNTAMDNDACTGDGSKSHLRRELFAFTFLNFVLFTRRISAVRIFKKSLLAICLR